MKGSRLSTQLMPSMLGMEWSSKRSSRRPTRRTSLELDIQAWRWGPGRARCGRWPSLRVPRTLCGGLQAVLRGVTEVLDALREGVGGANGVLARDDGDRPRWLGRRSTPFAMTGAMNLRMLGPTEQVTTSAVAIPVRDPPRASSS